MQVLDYHRSFIVWEIDFAAKPPRTVSDPRQNRHNCARIRIDGLCRITRPSGAKSTYYLGESCKTERVGCPRKMGIFIRPNADFRMAYSPDDECVIFKSWDRNDKGVRLTPPSLGLQPERQVVRADEAFFRHRLRLRSVPAVRLAGFDRIAEAALAGRPLVARTEFRRAGFRVLLEYPIFTFNVSDRHRFYQTDTGPVLFPDLGPGTRRPAASLRLAYSAFNRPSWIEFIIQRRTPVGKGISVNHYSRIVQVAARNSIFATS